MNDDWRVEVDVPHRGGLQHLRDGMRERGIAREAGRELADRVKVTVDEDRLFAYGETEADVKAAGQRLLELAAEHDLEATATVARWHPEEERWEPAEVPLPSTPAEHAAERAALEAQQAAETDERGYAMWEVRLELPDHDQAEAVTARLEAEGLAAVCRSHHVVVGLRTEDDARSLAERLRVETPDALSVTAEGSAAVAMDEVVDPLTRLSGRWRRT